MAMRLHELHPTLVHAPLVLTPFAVIADLVGSATRNTALLSFGRRLMPWAAASGAMAAVAGLAAQEVVRPQGEARDLLTTHRTLNLGLVGTIALMAVARQRTSRPGAGYLLLGLAGLAGMTYSAYLGGKMVYDHGVGVRPAGGLDEARSPEIGLRNAGQWAREGATHAMHGAQHAVEHARTGDLAPSLRRSAVRSGAPGAHVESAAAGATAPSPRADSPQPATMPGGAS
jgi:uncharacterized membrane protein